MATREEGAESAEGEGVAPSGAEVDFAALLPHPAAFLCPITQELMKDPVATSDGFVYERAAIQEWFTRCPTTPPTSPMTGTPLTSVGLSPNVALRLAIEAYRLQRHVELPDMELSSVKEIVNSMAEDLKRISDDKAAEKRLRAAEQQNLALKAAVRRLRGAISRLPELFTALRKAPPLQALVTELQTGFQELAAVAEGQISALQGPSHAGNTSGVEGDNPDIPSLVTQMLHGDEEALRTLRLVTRYSEMHRTAIAAAGGIPPLVAMLTHKSLGVRDNACATIGNVTCNDNALRAAVVAAGGVKPLVAMLQCDVEVLQYAAALTLRNLPLNPEVRPAIVAEGAIPLLVGLFSHPSSRVAAQSAGAVCNLAVGSQANQDAAGERGALPLLVKMLQDPNTNSQEIACYTTLSLLLRNENNQEAFRVAGGVPVVVNLLSHSSTTVLERSLQILRLENPRSTALAIQQGAISKLSGLLSHSSSLVQRLAAGLIEDLAKGGEENCAAIAGSGVLEVLLDLAVEPRSPIVKEAVTGALRALARDSQTAEILKRLGCVIVRVSSQEMADEADSQWRLRGRVESYP